MFITLHQAHHELTVLAEILSGKEDMTRKLEIIRFVKLWLRIYLLIYDLFLLHFPLQAFAIYKILP